MSRFLLKFAHFLLFPALTHPHSQLHGNHLFGATRSLKASFIHTQHERLSSAPQRALFIVSVHYGDEFNLGEESLEIIQSC